MDVGRTALKIGLEILCLLLVGLPWVILQFQEPFHRGFYCDDQSLKHPYKESTVPSAVVATFGNAVPILTILLTEGVYARRAGAAAGGLSVAGVPVTPYITQCYPLIGVFLFGEFAQQTITNIGKYSIGRLRPHFFSICRPDFAHLNCTDARGYARYVTEDGVCTGDDAHRLKEMRLSFPSGHASLSCYCMVFLVLYLEARLRVPWSRLLRPFLQVLAVWAALATCLSRISDYKHHWGDVLFGALNGTIVALIAAVYMARLFPQKSCSLEPLASGRRLGAVNSSPRLDTQVMDGGHGDDPERLPAPPPCSAEGPCWGPPPHPPGAGTGGTPLGATAGCVTSLAAGTAGGDPSGAPTHFNPDVKQRKVDGFHCTEL